MCLISSGDGASSHMLTLLPFGLVLLCTRGCWVPHPLVANTSPPAPAVVTKMSRDIVNVPWGTKVSLVENHWNDLNWIAGLKHNFFICISTLFYLESEMQGWIVPTQPKGPSAGRRGLYPTGPKREELHHHSAVNTATGGGRMPGGTAGERNGPWAVGQRGAGLGEKQPTTGQEEP